MLIEHDSPVLLNGINNTSTNTKKYYWMKLPIDFFQSRNIKKLRKIAGGDTHVVILLKLMLQTVKTNGVLEVGINPEEDIAIDLDEDINNIKICLSYLRKQSMIEEFGSSILVSSVPPLIGSETANAERTRLHRQRKKEENQGLLQCNTNVTSSNNNVTQNRIQLHQNKTDLELDLQQQNKKELSSFVYLQQFLDLKLRTAKNKAALETKIRSELQKGNQSYIDDYNSFVASMPVDFDSMSDEQYLRHVLIGEKFTTPCTNALGHPDTNINEIISVAGAPYSTYILHIVNEFAQCADIQLHKILPGLSIKIQHALEDRFGGVFDVC